MKIKSTLSDYYVHETIFAGTEFLVDTHTFLVKLNYQDWQIDETGIGGLNIIFQGVKEKPQKTDNLYGEEVLDIDLNSKSNDVKIIFDNDNVDILEFKATSVEVFKNN